MGRIKDIESYFDKNTSGKAKTIWNRAISGHFKKRKYNNFNIGIIWFKKIFISIQTHFLHISSKFKFFVFAMYFC